MACEFVPWPTVTYYFLSACLLQTGRTAMHFSAERGQAVTLQWLIKKGAKNDQRDVVRTLRPSAALTSQPWHPSSAPITFMPLNDLSPSNTLEVVAVPNCVTYTTDPCSNLHPRCNFTTWLTLPILHSRYNPSSTLPQPCSNLSLCEVAVAWL